MKTLKFSAKEISPDLWEMAVVEQSHRGEEFGINCLRFSTKNVQFVSAGGVDGNDDIDYDDRKNHIFVRGSVYNNDNDTFIVETVTKDLILAAAAEYEACFAYKPDVDLNTAPQIKKFDEKAWVEFAKAILIGIYSNPPLCDNNLHKTAASVADKMCEELEKRKG
jgi:hypothetical protein